MRVFIINDKVILDVINNLTVEDKIKDIVKDIILRFDYNYVNYIYSVFSAYVSYYISIVNENSNLTKHDVAGIYNKFRKHNIDPVLRNVFIADVYDVIFATSDFDKTKYKFFFYDDMYSRLVNISNETEASIVMEDVFGSLEAIFGSVEETILFGLIQTDEMTKDMIIYTEINNNCLMLYIL